jgi:hypothetical protein
MRTRRLTLVPHMAFPVLLTLMDGQMLGLAPDASAQAKKLEGTWRTELTVFDCQMGTPTGATAQILETYLPGGAMLQSSNTNVFRSPGYGIWKHTTKRNFLVTFTFFRFNADGTQAGRSDITEHIELGEDADEFTATLVNKTFDANGNLISTTCPTETGECLTFDE